MFDFAISAINILFSFFEKNEAKKQKYSDYIKQIIFIIDDVIAHIERDENPHGACAAMRTHLEHFDDVFKNEDSELIKDVKNNLWRAVDIEGLYYEAKKPDAIKKLKELSGSTKALSDLILI